MNDFLDWNKILHAKNLTSMQQKTEWVALIQRIHPSFIACCTPKHFRHSIYSVELMELPKSSLACKEMTESNGICYHYQYSLRSNIATDNLTTLYPSVSQKVKRNKRTSIKCEQ